MLYFYTYPNFILSLYIHIHKLHSLYIHILREKIDLYIHNPFYIFFIYIYIHMFIDLYMPIYLIFNFSLYIYTYIPICNFLSLYKYPFVYSLSKYVHIERENEVCICVYIQRAFIQRIFFRPWRLHSCRWVWTPLIETLIVFGFYLFSDLWVKMKQLGILCLEK